MEEAKDFKEIEKLEEANLMEFLFYMEYKLEKADVYEDERNYQDNLRKQKKGKR